MFLTYRNDFRGAATLALGPARAREARWTSGAIPTLENSLPLLGDLLRPVCSHWSLAIQDDSTATTLDAAEGHYGWYFFFSINFAVLSIKLPFRL